MTNEEAERGLRARSIVLRDTLLDMAAQAHGLFHTSGWIRTSEEMPPVGMRVLGMGNLIGWYELKDNGKWVHDYMNGRVCEEPSSWGPEFWMVLPPVPK